MGHIIDVKNVFFSYPVSTRNVLAGCSLSIDSGELISILGPNGAGKSTLLNCSCGLLTPKSGSVLLNGKDIKTIEQKDIAKVVGYVQQNQQATFSYSVFQYVLMGRACNIGLFQKPSQKDEQITYDVLESMGLSHLANAAITEISGGERQQAAIARAVVQNPQVIFFDEPTAHLDYGNQINTLRLIASLREKGFAVIMTTHNPDHCMMLGGKVAILDRHGLLEVGACAGILTEDRLKKVYNTELRLAYVEDVKRVTCIPMGL